MLGLREYKEQTHNKEVGCTLTHTCVVWNTKNTLASHSFCVREATFWLLATLRDSCSVCHSPRLKVTQRRRQHQQQQQQRQLQRSQRRRRRRSSRSRSSVSSVVAGFIFAGGHSVRCRAARRSHRQSLLSFRAETSAGPAVLRRVVHALPIL